jgi:hypothetical protein
MKGEGIQCSEVHQLRNRFIQTCVLCSARKTTTHYSAHLQAFAVLYVTVS